MRGFFPRIEEDEDVVCSDTQNDEHGQDVEDPNVPEIQDDPASSKQIGVETDRNASHFLSKLHTF